jgi:hypothetical protein
MLLSDPDLTGSLAPGDPRRAPLGRAIFLTLGTGIAFVLATVAVKDVRVLSAAAPWGEDPYDAFYSFAIFFVAAIAFVNAVRVLLCRRVEPLPIERVDGLIRGSRVMLATMVGTIVAGWTGVAVGSGALASPLARVLVIGLAIITLLVAAATRALWVSSKPFVGLAVERRTSPDWLDDLTTLGLRFSGRRETSTSRRAALVLAVGRRFLPVVRRHPFGAASLIALTFGSLIGLGAALEEEPLLLVLVLTVVGAAAMLGFLVAVGSYLRLVRPAAASTGRPTWLAPVLAAAISAPITVAFRDGLWWLIGSNPEDARLEQLAGLLAVVAVLSCTATVTVMAIRQRSKRR